jgi:hypothetical protein
MKRLIDTVLNLVPLLAPIPTGWAVYAGLTLRSTWPMPWYVAIPGAVALVAVSISVSAYIIETAAYNKSLRRADTLGDQAVQPAGIIPGWILLGVATIAEIVLALLIGVIPGLRTYAVLAFPLLSLAGMFTFVLRTNLAERIGVRDRMRAERRTTKAIRSQSAPDAMLKRRSASHGPKSWPDTCPHCGASMRSAQGWSSHSGRWCPVLHPKSGGPVAAAVQFEQLAKGRKP